jgi:hypothetical protein
MLTPRAIPMALLLCPPNSARHLRIQNWTQKGSRKRRKSRRRPVVGGCSRSTSRERWFRKVTTPAYSPESNGMAEASVPSPLEIHHIAARLSMRRGIRCEGERSLVFHLPRRSHESSKSGPRERSTHADALYPRLGRNADTANQIRAAMGAPGEGKRHQFYEGRPKRNVMSSLWRLTISSSAASASEGCCSGLIDTWVVR